ncbi:MAG: hypothetical protein Q9212_004664 [Teloschistes hypoglaucus]
MAPRKYGQAMVRQRLAIAHNLQKEKKKKPVLHAEDEFELLKTLYISTETTFPHERYRVQLALVMQLPGITGNRPSALLSVRYQHIKVNLLEDPDRGEQPRVLIEIVFHHTKGYLGEKDAYGFPFHVVFAPASDCVAVANGRGRNEFGIPDVPNEPCLLLCPHITMLALLFADQAFAAPSLTSPEQLFRLRIAPGQKQLPVRLQAQQNIILQHHNSFVFQKNYASRYMPDTQAAYRGLKPQTALMRAASGMSRTIDPRRPRKLNLAQRAEVDRHPEVKERYKKEQPVIDIQRQLKGFPVAEQEALEAAGYVFAERVHAIDALFTFATSSTEQECQRRVTAINALIALCKKQESQGFRRRKANIKVIEEQTSVSPPPSLSETLSVKCKATQCIFCLGNKDLSAADRLKTFAARGDLKKNFHRKHLRHHPAGQPIACPHPRCDVTLNGTIHLQNHAEVVHRTPT